MSNSNMAWLEEVKADARRITLKRIADEKAEREYLASKLGEAVPQDEPAEAPEVEAPAEARKSKKGK